MKHAHHTRRTVIKTLGLGLAGGATVVGSVNAEDDALAAELNTVRHLSRTYRDIDTARADGYLPISPYVPGMGFHFAAGSPYGSDLKDPGVLVYFTNGRYNPAPGQPHDPAHDDDLVLGAVEWLVRGNQESDPPDIFSDGDSHRTLRVTESAGWHYESERDFTGLHAWVHRGNPAGVFHPTNPEID